MATEIAQHGTAYIIELTFGAGLLLACAGSLWRRILVVVGGRCESRLSMDLGVGRLGGGFGAVDTMEALALVVCVACGVGVVVVVGFR